MTSQAHQIVTTRLASSETGLEMWLWLPLLQLLAQGRPVELDAVAAATSRPVEEVRRALAVVPDTEYDEAGWIVGQGLTLRPTQHSFEVEGRQLYTWCALDTLIFPTVLGTAARIESTYQEGATPIRVGVDASGVTSLDPATAVVSLVNPEDLSSVRAAFCNQVHFFPSPAAAEPWTQSHPGGTVIPVAEAYRLASSLAEKMLNPMQPHYSPAAAAAPNTAPPAAEQCSPKLTTPQES